MTSKYHAKKRQEHTPPHDSLKECRRYSELKLLERAGEIRNLKDGKKEKLSYDLLPATKLFGRKVPALRYEPDFSYEESYMVPQGFQMQRAGVTHVQMWRAVTEDVKGLQTPAFRIKARLLLEKHGIEVRLT